MLRGGGSTGRGHPLLLLLPLGCLDGRLFLAMAAAVIFERHLVTGRGGTGQDEAGDGGARRRRRAGRRRSGAMIRAEAEMKHGPALAMAMAWRRAKVTDDEGGDKFEGRHGAEEGKRNLVGER